MKATFGTLFTLLAAVSAAPFSTPASHFTFSGHQLDSLLSVLSVHNVHSKLDVDQNISCTVAYTLALSKNPLLLFLLRLPANEDFRLHWPTIHH